MPLLDHFHPPLSTKYPWDSFHSGWATRIADELNEQWLPPDFLAAEHTHAGPSLEIDIATFERPSTAPPAPRNGPQTVTLPRTWTPPTPAHQLLASFPDNFEVKIISTSGGQALVGAIELVSPGNKDRADERRAFAGKCASYLHQGVSVVVIDIVTNRSGNLHNELLRFLGAPEATHLPADLSLYAAAYRPVLRDDKPELDVWTARCALGQPLPTLPLRLTGDLFVPVEFEASYHETCRRRRLTSDEGGPAP
jgi:Protein of unknown function (DUF4058)